MCSYLKKDLYLWCTARGFRTRKKIQYSNCINFNKNLLKAYRGGYCRDIYTKKQIIKGKECKVEYFRHKSKVTTYSIDCDGKKEIINELPIPDFRTKKTATDTNDNAKKQTSLTSL